MAIPSDARTLSALLLLAGSAACSPGRRTSIGTPPLSQAATSIEPLTGCTGIPAALDGAGLYNVGAVLFGPAHPLPGQTLYISTEQAIGGGLVPDTVTAEITTAGVTSYSVTLSVWCTLNNGTEQILGTSLGSFDAGASVSVTLTFTNGRETGTQGPFVLEVEDAPSLSWIGSTETAYATSAATSAPYEAPETDAVVPADFVVANYDLQILTQTYPERAASTVTLFWANADDSSITSAPMALVGDGAGDYGNNDEFRATIPAAALSAGQTVHYWVEAVDASGHALYDSQGGANYTVVPRSLSVAWAGNLGAYDAQGGPDYYTVGELFNSDLSTTVGCVENGYDDYPVQAIQVYVPGLTDQGYTGDVALAASAILQAELWTNLQPNGWGGIAMPCRAGNGNNYVCNLMLSVFPEGGSCLPGGGTMPVGTYQYKVRFSVDNGNTLYWVGTTDGSGGGSNLNVDYNPSCLYAANNPNNCNGL